MQNILINHGMKCEFVWAGHQYYFRPSRFYQLYMAYREFHGDLGGRQDFIWVRL